MHNSPGRRGRQAPAGGTWRNWAGNVTATPARWATPRTEAEISASVNDAAGAGLQLRALGSGHSFTPAAATDGLALDLSGWAGIIAADTRSGLVTVRSGTTLRALNAGLAPLGLALANLGDIDVQTVAGALATGTHGTGARLGGMATQIEALDLVLADGSLVSCSASARPELFAAARVGLGAVGVVTAVTLRCVPSFTLAADERPMPVEQLIEEFGARAAPRLIPALNRFSSVALSARAYTDASYRVFVTPRRVHFVESEYAVPRESLPGVLAELRRAVPRLADPVMFPVEVRVAAADDIWLSTAYGRDTAYIAIHQYTGLPYRAYFDLFESVVAAVAGRPHWGKMHTLDAARLGPLYPRFEDFRRVRAEVDPENRFGNAYLGRVFGPAG